MGEPGWAPRAALPPSCSSVALEGAPGWGQSTVRVQELAQGVHGSSAAPQLTPCTGITSGMPSVGMWAVGEVWGSLGAPGPVLSVNCCCAHQAGH